MLKSRRFDKAKYRDDPKAVAKYLNGAPATGAGLRRESLYRSSKGEVSPALDRVMNVLIALDVEFLAGPRAVN